jgi:hypothetical protein
MQVIGFCRVYSATTDLLVNILLCGIHNLSHLYQQQHVICHHITENSGLYKIFGLPFNILKFQYHKYNLSLPIILLYTHFTVLVAK